MHAILSCSRLIVTNAATRHTESESVSSNSRETPSPLHPRVSRTESTIVPSSPPTAASNTSVSDSTAKPSNTVAPASSSSVKLATPLPKTLTSSLSSSTNQASSSKKQWTHKGSPQLMRWARSRRIRSLSPSKTLKKETESEDSSLTNGSSSTTQIDMVENEYDDDDVNNENSQPENIIYMVSDGTGWTAEHCVSAALGQFEHCLVDHVCPVNTHLFSQISDPERLIEIIKDARKDNATFVYTLADPDLAQTAKKACKLYGVPSLDILGPITELLGSHMGVPPSGVPRGAPGSRNVALTEEYFKRIEAIEFTIKQDDGALPQNLHKADLVLVGVSRTSKTPLSTYMAQKGYKVANVPLVFGIDPPKELFEIDQSRIYGLTIDANFLQAIRQARYKTLGVSSTSFYSDMDHIKKELVYSNKLFSQNPIWPVIAVTGKAIEETAAVILRIYHDREKKHSMPRISHRY